MLIPDTVTRRFRGVAFDLDGTLMDTLPGIAESVNGLLVEAGLNTLPQDQIEQYVGDGAPTLIRRSLAAAGGTPEATSVSVLVAEYGRRLSETPPGEDHVYPGVAETLAALRRAGIKVAICTNKPERPAIAALAAVGIDKHVDALVAGDSLPQRKPDPTPLLTVLARIMVDPDQAAMVGDSANDVRTARAANVPAVAVSYGYPRMPLEQLGADVIINRFDDLPAALGRLADGALG